MNDELFTYKGSRAHQTETSHIHFFCSWVFCKRHRADTDTKTLEDKIATMRDEIKELKDKNVALEKEIKRLKKADGAPDGDDNESSKA